MGIRMLTAAAVALATTLATAPAHADRLTEADPIAPDIKLSDRIKTNVTRLSGELGKHISALSFDLIGMRFDAHTNKARVHLDTGDEHQVSLRMDSDVHFRGGVARVRARFDLGLAGRRVSFELPEFDMVPRSYGGRQYVELRLPLIEGQF